MKPNKTTIRAKRNTKKRRKKRRGKLKNEKLEEEKQALLRKTGRREKLLEQQMKDRIKK